MNRKRILIIDDDIPLSQTMKINLEATDDYEVLVEKKSSQALSAAREFRPDLILLDVIMPDLDGGDVSALLQSDPILHSVPVIMVTALVSNGETGSDLTVANGDTLMVAKPIRFEKLVAAIESGLSPHPV